MICFDGVIHSFDLSAISNRPGNRHHRVIQYMIYDWPVDEKKHVKDPPTGDNVMSLIMQNYITSDDK